MKYTINIIFILFIFSFSCTEKKETEIKKFTVEQLLSQLDTITSSPMKPTLAEIEIKPQLDTAIFYEAQFAVFHQFIERYPLSIEVHSQFQDFMYANQKRQEIMSLYDSLLKRNPDKEEFYYLFARIQHNEKIGAELIDKALNINPEFYWANIQKGMYLSHYFEIDTNAVLSYYIKAIKINNSIPIGFEKVADIFYNYFSDFERALNFYQLAYNSDTTSAINIENLLSIYKEMKRYPEYIEFQNNQLKHININKKPAIYYELARVYSLANNTDSAIFYLEKAEKENFVSFLNYKKEKDFAFIRDNEKFNNLQNSREKIEDLQLLNLIKSNETDLSKISDTLQILIKTEELIKLLEKRQDFTKCLFYYEKLFKLSPDTKRYIFNCAKFNYLKGNITAAFEFLQKLSYKGFHNTEIIQNTFPDFSENKEFIQLIEFMNKANQEFANNREIKKYTVADGLTHKNFWSIFQDSKQNIWIGAENGLNKYDGERITTYTSLNGMSYQYSKLGIEDNNGNLLFVTNYQGLIKYDGTTFTQYGVKDGLIGNHSYSNFVKDSSGIIWFGLNEGLVKYDGENFTNFTFADGLTNSEVNCILKNDNELWVGTAKGIQIFDGKTFSKIYTTTEGLPSNHIQVIIADKKGNIWIATNKGLSKYDGKRFTNYYMEDGLISNNIYRVLIDYSGKIWLGFNTDGISVLTDDGFVNYDLGCGNTYDTQAMIEDANHNIWICARTRAVCKIKEKEFVVSNKLNNISVKNFYTDANKNVIVNSVNDTIYTYHGKKICYKSMSSDKMNKYLLDKKNNLWITAYYGSTDIYRYDGVTTKIYTSADGIPDARGVTNIADDAKGNVWFCLWGNGILKFDGNSFIHYNTTNGLASKMTKDLTKDKNNNIWIVYDNKSVLTKFDGTNFIHYSFENINNNFAAWNIYSENENIWIGSYYGGVLKFDGSKFSLLQNENTVEINAISKIAKDFDNHIWIMPFAAIATKYNENKQDYVVYNAQSGFTGSESGSNITIGTDSIIWFGETKQNSNIIKLDTRTMDKFLPINQICKLVINDSLEYTVFSNMELKYNENNIAFYYSGINFKSDGLIKYKTILEGYDKEWSATTKQAEIKYMNLYQGNYTFKVISRNQHGYWNETPATLSFTILPPWWQTWWFRIFAIVFILFAFYAIYKYRVRKLEKEKEKLENLVKQRTFEIQQKNVILEQQKEEIIVQNEHLQEQKEEILTQNNELNQKNEEILTQNEELNIQKEQLEKQSKNIRDSIKYASKIQQAILPSLEIIEQNFDNYFVLFRPCHIVSGDFYWFKQIKNFVFVVAADCTGHGVPGAFMSMLGVSLLNEIINRRDINPSNQILNELRKRIKKLLHQTGQHGEQQDGMDIALCIIDMETKLMQFSGAYNPLYLIRNNELIEYKADRMPIGIHPKDQNDFTATEIQLQSNDSFYIFSDGYVSQFGGERDEKFKSKRFQELLLKINNEPIKKQHEILEQTIENWRGNTAQTDDILVIGIKI